MKDEVFMRALIIGIITFFMGILVIVWVFSKAADPVFLEFPDTPTGEEPKAPCAQPSPDCAPATEATNP